MRHLSVILLVAIFVMRCTAGEKPSLDDLQSSKSNPIQQLTTLLQPVLDIVLGLLKDVLGLLCGTMNGTQNGTMNGAANNDCRCKMQKAHLYDGHVKPPSQDEWEKGDPDTITKQFRPKGEIYVRWGKRECRDGSDLVYAGSVGGSNSLQDSGAAADYLCLPPDPQYEAYDPAMNNHAYVYGAQFVMWKIDIKGTLLDKKYTAKGVGCAVCKTSTTNSVIMIPGRKECYNGMTKEYGGYLMAGFHAHAGASQYICVDGNADTCASAGTSWRKLLYPVESVCAGTLKCPPYINGAEMTCVVCSM